MDQRRNPARGAGRTGLFVLVALLAGAGLAVPILARRTAPAPVSIATVGSGGITFPLVGLMSEGCVTTVRACLERLPGVERVSVTRQSASLVLKAATVDEKDVVALVRASGHEVEGSEKLIPRLAPLTEDEVRRLDELKGEWLDVHLKPPACVDCSMALEGRVRELTGVKEVVVIHFRDHLAVRRDPAVCSASRLAEHVRGITHEPVTIGPTKLVTLSVANMTCNKCIGSIRGVLLRTKGVLSPAVEMGRSEVVVESGTASKNIKDAIESAPGPACKTNPEHVFKAKVTDEKDDGPSR